MEHAVVAGLAGRQYNRISHRQLLGLGLSQPAIERRVGSGVFICVAEGVFAFAPLLNHDPWGRRMGAVLTQPGSRLSRVSAAVAFGSLEHEPKFVTVTRPGNGGPTIHGGVKVHRSMTLEGDCTTFRGIPITTVPRMLLDITGEVSPAALARALRESLRLERVSRYQLGDALGKYAGRRGSRQLATAFSRYTGLPIERARSGAEIRAMELIRDARLPLPRLNVDVADEEADLSWPNRKLIVEIDGGPFHQDVGEDARKEAAWQAAGWEVRRLPSDDVYEQPQRLIALAE